MPKNVEEISALKRQINALNERLSSLKENTSEYISENPLKSTLIAFGVGLVAGAVLLKLLEKK